MLNHTKKIKEIYEDIQKKIYYMIPEKWDKFYLYSSIIDMPNNVKTGELFFYYVPKGVLKKKPINVYEIPNKFNLDENEYLKLVELLYDKIKELREEFKNTKQELWSNITIIIQNARFRVEYDYEDLKNSDFTSYERHIIWRYKYLEIGPQQVSKDEKEILKRYTLGTRYMSRKEIYEFGIYVKDVGNNINYHTEQLVETTKEDIQLKNRNQRNNQKDNIFEEINKITSKNQILLSQEEIRKIKQYREQKKNI